jgi:pectate lyase
LGRIVKNEQEVGGCPAYASGVAPVSTAGDGTPDDWKKAHGLPLNDPAAATAVNADGYTQLEVYLNSLVKP